MSENARPSTWVTWVLIVLNVIVFGIEIAAGADWVSPTPMRLFELGGNYGPRSLSGEPWRLVSAMFLHAGIAHVAVNMFVLALWGRRVETLYGHARFAAIYIGSGLLGGVVSLALSPNVVSVGASGAIFGVFGAFGAYLLLRRDRVPAVWMRSAPGFAIYLAYSIYRSKAPGIDIGAHVGGLIAGLGLAVAMLIGARADDSPRVRSLAGIAASIAISVVAIVVLPAPRDFDTLLRDFHEVEHQCITTYNARLREAQANQIDEPHFADAIDKDVIGPWHALRSRIDAIPDADIPPRLTKLFQLLRTYTKDREDAWQAISALNHNPHNNTDEAKAHYHELEAKTRDDVKLLGMEIEGLKK
jgi:rhomboid protease GluP